MFTRDTATVRRFFIVFLPCLVAVICLVVATIFQGPRLRYASFTQQSSATGMAQLRLIVNQPIEELSSRQVTFDHDDVAYDIVTKDEVIIMRFVGNLEQDETFRVTLHNVKGKHSTATATISYTFSTPRASRY